MPGFYFCLRLLAVAAVFPAIARYIAGASLVHGAGALRRGLRAARIGSLRTALRIWMSVMDWTKGIPVGYSYWVQYQAPALLDEIEVHHDE